MDKENNENEFSSSCSSLSDDGEPTLDLDINALRQLASNRLNRHCVSTQRLTRGCYNEIHLLQFDAGPDCIARLSRRLTHPEEKFASEIATMKYVAQNTSIKVPEVYDWDSTVHNPIKTPYILMERLPGQHLYRVWDELTIEEKKGVLSQIIDTLLELWTKCQFEEIGCLYMDSVINSTFRIGPVVDPVFYIQGRNAIPSFTGPFRSSQELFNALIQKEKKFFEIHGAQELIKDKQVDEITAASEVVNLIKQLDSLQLKLSKLFDESIDQKPFVLLHGDLDAQNILVERSINDEIKIVGIVDWEFSRTGTLWNLCKYPIWIQEENEYPLSDFSDLELQESRERQMLRDFFHDEMVAKLGSKSGQILETKERDFRIDRLEDMFTYMVHNFAIFRSLLGAFFFRYGPEMINVHFDDPIIEFFWGGIIKIQIPPKEIIWHCLSMDKPLISENVPVFYIASVYYELKSNDYDFTWQQAIIIASYLFTLDKGSDVKDVKVAMLNVSNSDS